MSYIISPFQTQNNLSIDEKRRHAGSNLMELHGPWHQTLEGTATKTSPVKIEILYKGSKVMVLVLQTSPWNHNVLKYQASHLHCYGGIWWLVKLKPLSLRTGSFQWWLLKLLGQLPAKAISKHDPFQWDHFTYKLTGWTMQQSINKKR